MSAGPSPKLPIRYCALKRMDATPHRANSWGAMRAASTIVVADCSAWTRIVDSVCHPMARAAIDRSWPRTMADRASASAHSTEVLHQSASMRACGRVAQDLAVDVIEL